MRPDCAKLIREKAGRELTDAELKGIEARTNRARKDILRADPAKHAMDAGALTLEAAKLAKDAYLKDVVKGFEQSLLQAKVHGLNVAQLAAVKPGKNGQSQFLYDKWDTIQAKTHAIASTITSTFMDPKSFPKGKWMGLLADPREVHDLARAAFGQEASPEAVEMARQFKAASDALLDRGRTLGIDIHNRENYAVPISYDTTKVAAVKADEFIADLKDRLHRDSLLNPDGTRKTDQEIAELLRASHSSIATDGAVNRIDGPTGNNVNRSRLGANINMERQLQWKSAEDWSYVQNKYGIRTNAYDLLTTHMTRIAHTLAIAETFGVDIDTNWNELLNRAKTADIEADGKNASKINSIASKAQRAFNDAVHPKGAVNARAANISANVRGGLNSAYLGSLNMIPDLVGLGMVANLHGIPVMKTFGDFCKGLARDAAGREQLARMGMALNTLHQAANRMDYEMVKSGPGKFLSGLVFHASGMERFDSGMREAAALGVSDILGKHNGLSETLAGVADPDVQRMIKAYDIAQDHWNVWRLAERQQFEGHGTLITAPDIMRIPDEKVAPLAEARVRERSDALAGQINRLRERNAFDMERIETRRDKLSAAQQRARDYVAELRSQHETRVDKAETKLAELADAIESKVQALGAAHDLISAQIMGKKEAAFDARVKVAKRDVEALAKRLENSADKREKANAQKFLDRFEELDALEKDIQNQIESRKDRIGAFETKASQVLTEEVFKMKAEAAEKLQEAGYRHTQVAARGGMGATAQDRIAMRLDLSQAGDLGGEIHRFFLQFKSTPLGIFRAHWNVANELPNANWKDLSTLMGSKQAYRAKFVAYSMLMGAVTREIMGAIKGQDPRTMDPSTPDGRKFWLESLATGGGLGIWGELLAGGQTRAGSGAEVIFGPAVSASWNLLKEYNTAVEEANKGESKHSYALAGSRWIQQNAVPLSKVWYVRTAANRMVFDQLQEYLSPGITARRIERQRRQGITNWWEPGEMTPSRAPDLSRMVAGEGE